MGKLGKFEKLRVRPGEKVHLGRLDTDTFGEVPSREKADEDTAHETLRLGELQDTLYAEGSQALLVIFQGMDASGKDGAVRNVFDAVNPTGIQVTSFKQPSAEELAHDFTWRCHNKAPPRGYIGVFNRSHYEDVLVVRVHADKLLPAHVEDRKGEWKRRYEVIREFEDILTKGRTRVLKFFLHISKGEQKKRFLSRQKDPSKRWKLRESDFDERAYWDDYQEAYEQMLPATSTPDAPWYVIPSDHNWVRNYCLSHVIVGALQEMDPKMPEVMDKGLIKRKFK